MSEYSNIIQGSFGSAPIRAVSAIDDNPDEAARALDLSSSTGVPAPAIAGDLEGFERQHKAKLAGDIVRNNPQLADYIDSHPLAAAISNDDLGNLDKVSEKAAALAQLRRLQAPKVMGVPTEIGERALSEGAAGIKAGWGEPGAWMTDAEVQNHRLLGAVGLTGELPFRALNALMQGALGLAHGGATAGYEAFGGSPTEAQRFARDITGMAEMQMMGTGVHAPGPPVIPAKTLEAIHAARPWLNEGLEPPRGVHPEIDRLKTEANKIDLDHLDEALKDSQASATRERNPDMFAGFIRQHLGDAKIGISGDRIAELYGDKIPHADDNLLGWVPGIKEQLDAYRETGSDIQVPIADWLARVDPAVAKDLHDDIRVQPGNITTKEAAETEVGEAKPIVDAPLAQTRAAASLEPLFSIGDRKLQLQRFGEPVKGFENFHDFQIMDDKGNAVGVLNLSTQGKQLYVEGIEGISGFGPRDFGPSLMRDLLRQLKAEFPEAETISGYRISGARFGEAAVPNNIRSRQPVVKLDTLDNVEDFAKSLQEQQWTQIGKTLMADFRPRELYTENEKALTEAVEAERQRLTPKGVTVEEAHGIKPLDPEDKGRIHGAYQQFLDRNPIIVWSLKAPDPIGTYRHEAIHHLRSYGFFNEVEWKTLTDAAKSEGWIEKYNIDRRYKNADTELKLEEAVAEGFRDWNKQQDNLSARAKSIAGIESPLDTIFRRIKELLSNIGDRFKEILGYEPTWQELFEDAHSGEIGSREGTEPLNPAAFKAMLDQGEERQNMLKANATGLDITSYKRIQKLIEQRHQDDIAAANKRAEREQAQKQTAEWKTNRKEVRAEVDESIRNRPDVAADLFFGSGELFGQKLARGYRLRTEDLTPEQRDALPKHYQAKDGIPPDEAAKLFGYGSGDAMVQKLAELNTAKGKIPAQEFLKQLVEQETDRQMEQRYGLLEKNIMEDAKDQALSETQLNILAEEMHAVGMQAGVKTIDADVAKAWVKDKFKSLPIGDITSDHFLRDVGRHGRDAERLLIGGDPAVALQSLQKKYLSALFANEARKLEKEVSRFDRDAKRLSKRVVTGMEPEYTNFVHQILMQIGKPVRRSEADLKEQIAASGHADIESFVATKEADLRELPVADFLLDEKWQKPYDTLSVDEFRAVRDSIKALAFNGRDEMKIYRAGEAADLAEKKTEMMDQLEQFQIKHYDTKGGRWMGPIPPKGAKVIRIFGAIHMQLENLMNRWDHFDRRGVWTQYVMRDLIEGANQESAWRTEYSKKLIAVDDGADLSKSVDNQLFRDPLGGGLMNFTRKNLRTVLLYAGNESNLVKMAGGYGLKPKQVWDWLNIHTTKEDWDWAQKIGDLFAEIKGKSDTMYRSLTGGVAPESIEIKSLDTAHGKYAGWYYPIIFHPEFEGKSKKLMGGDALENANYVRATTPAGYTKGRTGYVAPLALDLDALPGRMASMIHDIALRPAVINASKVFYDKDVRSKIGAHYGTEYRDLLVPYLKDVANSANYNSKAQMAGAQWSEFVRQNMISTLVGLNPGTVMKHGPTAFVQSMMEVGPVNFLKALKSLTSVDEATGESNWQFAMKESQELQRRDRNYQETLSGATEALMPTSKFQSMRQTVINFAAKPVALSDKLSAVPTWLAQYTKSMEDNGGIHGDAVFDADRAVRRAHGSTAITNRPVVMRGGAGMQWFSSVYGFFNHIMNRQAELVWKSGDALGLVKDGQYAEAMSKVPELSAMLFAYVIAPAIIEELVSPLASSDNESWGKKAAKGIGFTLGASWVGVRDLSSAMLNGRDPSAGLISTAGQQVVNLARDYGKQQPLNKEHAGKIIQDATGLFGTATGLTPLQLGRSARFGYGVGTGVERPKGPWGWMVGMRYGTLDKHSRTFEEWRKHH